MSLEEYSTSDLFLLRDEMREIAELNDGKVNDWLRDMRSAHQNITIELHKRVAKLMRDAK